MKNKLIRPLLLSLLVCGVVLMAFSLSTYAKAYADTTLPTPKGAKAVVKSTTTNEISWKMPDEYNIDYYEVYRKSPSGNTYIKVKKVGAFDYYDWDYNYDYFKVSDYISGISGGKFNYKIVAVGTDDSSYEEIFSQPAYCSVVNVRLGAPGSVSASTNGYQSISLSWSKVSGASGYNIYRQKVGSSSKVLVKRTTSSKWINYNLSKNVKYTYTVVPYKLVNDVRYVGKGKSVTGNTGVLKTSITSIISYSNKAIITWNKLSGVSGYEVYRATSLNGRYTRVSLVSGSGSTKFTNTKLTTSKKYYYKVRGYKNIRGSKYVGSFSSVKSKIISNRTYTYYEANQTYRELKNALMFPSTLRLYNAYCGTIKGQKVTMIEYSAENAYGQRIRGYYTSTYDNDGWYSTNYYPSNLSNRVKLNISKIK